MPRPATTTPYGPPVPSSVLNRGESAPTSSTPTPADLNTSWRVLMAAVGQGVPYHLNRAVRVNRRMLGAVRLHA